ncbi:hypothetical protein [Sulfurimonas diazotrophicus]|uniref:Uncharacterized protein n=1 Tax=Sulfurimonas diazotrophicus TaxID=3131939 RepID=A0ABZ3H8V4_9BACT
MYELSGLKYEVVTDLYESLNAIDSKVNSPAIITFAIKQAFHRLEPNIPFHVVKTLLGKLLKPYLDRKQLGIYDRKFVDMNEARVLFDATYGEILDECQSSGDEEDQYLSNLIYLLYDLLEYDRVIIVEKKTELWSLVNLIHWGKMHADAMAKRDLLAEAKPQERNIDIALNTNTAYADKIKFLKDDVAVINPFAKNEVVEWKDKIINLYVDDFRLISRAIYNFSQIVQEHGDIPYIRAFGELEPYIDSDMTISKRDFYISWYAYVVGIFNKVSNYTAPLGKVIEVAHLSSMIVFPELIGKEPLVNTAKAKVPIRERAFFKGLRLYEFTDKRLKIERSDEEIAFTERYMLEVTKELNKFRKS